MSNLPRHFYSVYDARTDAFLCQGYGTECAVQLDMKYRDFKSMVCRAKKGQNKKYIVLEDIGDGEED